MGKSIRVLLSIGKCDSMFDQSSQSPFQSEFEFFKPKIAVVGVGGAGNNTVQRLSTLDIKGASLGAGGFPEIGEKCAELSRREMEILLKDSNLVFVTAGMGGGTGTGAMPVVARMAKEMGAIVVGIVTLPFSLERVRLETAKKGIEKLRQAVDTLIVIDNQRLVQLYPNLPIEQTFMLADEITAKAVRGITETITQPSLINLDFADVRAIMSGGGLAMISVGMAQGSNKVDEAVKATLKNKLLDVDYSQATGVLMHIIGGPDLTLGEANEIGTKLTEKLPANSSVTWGARLDPNYTGKAEIIAIFTGVGGASVVGKKEEESEFGLGML
jgi:cell division protein FtsZ